MGKKYWSEGDEDFPTDGPEQGWMGRDMKEMAHHYSLYKALMSLPRDSKSAFVMIGTDGTTFELSREDGREIIRNYGRRNRNRRKR